MNPTLQRSCKKCVSAKSRCDLRLPRCSRCIRRKVSCVYANEPLAVAPSPRHCLVQFGALDPFESYPHVRLPKAHVQRLIHTFLYKIAFQYYPLDPNPNSNPFLVSWWPTALGDSALFHVSLQTACLDEEFLGHAGFQVSELLMTDSITLLRRKLQDPGLSMQDGTINSIITLATIEHGKGNQQSAEMHISGVKQLIRTRGGIQTVMQTSPLTARMVSWVSMLIMGTPQFETQDDNGTGYGIVAIPEWHFEQPLYQIPLPITKISVEPSILNIFVRLYSIFKHAKHKPLSSIKIHDLTCFTLHRLLHVSTVEKSSVCSPISECIRCALILYLLTLQGPAYYTHASMLHRFTDELQLHLSSLVMPSFPTPLDLWLVAVGLVASHGTPFYLHFQNKVRLTTASLIESAWQDLSIHIKGLLWLDVLRFEDFFERHWNKAIGTYGIDDSPEPYITSNTSKASSSALV